MCIEAKYEKNFSILDWRNNDRNWRKAQETAIHGLPPCYR